MIKRTQATLQLLTLETFCTTLDSTDLVNVKSMLTFKNVTKSSKSVTVLTLHFVSMLLPIDITLEVAGTTRQRKVSMCSIKKIGMLLE